MNETLWIRISHGFRVLERPGWERNSFALALLFAEGAGTVCCWTLNRSLSGSRGWLSLVLPVFRRSVCIYLHLDQSRGWEIILRLPLFGLYGDANLSRHSSAEAALQHRSVQETHVPCLPGQKSVLFTPKSFTEQAYWQLEILKEISSLLTYNIRLWTRNDQKSCFICSCQE